MSVYVAIRKRKLRRVLSAISATVLVTSIGCPWWIETASLRGLREIKRQMRAEGLPLIPADLNRPLPPADRNAARLYLQLTKALTDKPLEKSNPILNDVPRVVPIPPEKIAEIERGLRERQDVVQLIHQAAAKPDCVFPRDYALGPNLLFPEYAKMRQGLRVLTEESILQLQHDKPLEAIRNETLGFHIAQHTQEGAILISKLVAMSLNATTLRFMERVLYTAGDQPGVADAVAAAVTQNCKPVQAAEGMRGEIIMGEVVCDMLSQGRINELDDSDKTNEPDTAILLKSVFGKAFMRANELDLLQHQRQAFYLMALPYPEGKARLKTMLADVEAHRKMPTRVLTSILMPIFEQVTAKQAQGEAQKSIVCAAAAVMTYKRQNGKFPVALKQAMPTVPTDPFDGQALRYQQASDGFVVYSVGPTGKFDGGTTTKRPNSNESLFRFPMPAYYTQDPRQDAPASAPTPK